MASECGNMTYVSAKPNEDLVIAGVAQRGLWGSTDGGMSWHQLGSGGGSATITNRPGSIIYDPVRTDVFWESGIYNSNGVYRTDNGGSVFRSLGSIHHNDSVSVDFSDINRRTLLGEDTNKNRRFIVLRMAAIRGEMWEPISRQEQPFQVSPW